MKKETALDIDFYIYDTKKVRLYWNNKTQNETFYSLKDGIQYVKSVFPSISGMSKFSFLCDGIEIKPFNY